MPMLRLNNTFLHATTGVEPTAYQPVRMLERELGAAASLDAHSHSWGQLTLVLTGSLRVTVDNSVWIVPPGRAIWIPPLAMHKAVTLEPANIRAVYVLPEVAPFQSTETIVLDVSPLLRELVTALATCKERSAREKMIFTLILDEMSESTSLPLGVVLPSEKRLTQLCNVLVANPSCNLTLADWAKEVGASERTLARLFEQDLGMSFTRWRQQVRLAHATSLIASGKSLAYISAELGYSSQSAFSAMFKKTFGKSPSAFLVKHA